MQNELNIRLAKLSDLQSIVDIYNQAIQSKCATGDLEEFNVKDRIQWFEKFNPKEYPLYIAELDNQVVGYCTLSPYRPGRKAMSRVAEISYYVDYTKHGTGIGTALLKYVIEDCKRIGKDSLLAILLDINSQSIGLLEKFEFEQWGHFPNIINMHDQSCGHLIYGLKIKQSK